MASQSSEKLNLQYFQVGRYTGEEESSLNVRDGSDTNI